MECKLSQCKSLNKVKNMILKLIINKDLESAILKVGLGVDFQHRNSTLYKRVFVKPKFGNSGQQHMVTGI